MAKAGLDQAIPFMVDGSANAHAASKYLLQTETVEGDGFGRAGAAAALPWLAGSRNEIAIAFP
jgi:hypothetical protein